MLEKFCFGCSVVGILILVGLTLYGASQEDKKIIEEMEPVEIGEPILALESSSMGYLPLGVREDNGDYAAIGMNNVGRVYCVNETCEEYCKRDSK